MEKGRDQIMRQLRSPYETYYYHHHHYYYYYYYYYYYSMEQTSS
jgi:hypothetical protein